MKVTVVGAGGHVGLPLAIVLAKAGHFVYGLDINAQVNAAVMRGEVPFVEEHAEELLQEVLSEKRLQMTDKMEVIADSEVVIVIIGTPIDENLNPRVDHLIRFFQNAKPHLKNQLIVLRSTVSPGTTDSVRRAIGIDDDSELDLVFGPERVLQGKSIQEIKTLPQIIGAYSEKSYKRADAFFRTFIQSETHFLKPIEAELGKLITNMARYVEFALANEFHIICGQFGANAIRIIDAVNKDYPRLKLPVPGPNVGGPCLYKDGWYLIERVPYNEMISSAFRINEGMTMQILQNIEKRAPAGKVAILGMTFKANSDDTRNSLSFKMRRQLAFKGYEIVTVDPHTTGTESIEAIRGADAVILMTPHREFSDLNAILKQVDNPNCWFVDIWGFWAQMRHSSNNGYFQANEVKSAS